MEAGDLLISYWFSQTLFIAFEINTTLIFYNDEL
ncbi:hypothetical protein SAMN05421855_104187 [Ulvibacter litoralis]|uniref:Uncharacterized protein n=1 Tax=Ulvibacter litoralis TaxID=227084 RepID=A0A1G7HMS4_9FLAO|nr:hypothetical protein SAMN05421855_104187 [Ulvibacter litoralis]